MIKAAKLRMSQVWRGEKVIPVTFLRLDREDLTNLQEGQKVKIVSLSKGRGFAGVVKRHGFAGGPKTHGQSDRWRAPGSLGGTTTPGRVYKGKRMAGRLGGEKRTLRTSLVKVEPQNQRLAVAGSVPGSFGTKVWLTKI